MYNIQKKKKGVNPAKSFKELATKLPPKYNLESSSALTASRP
jgi:hypothetical protein